MNILPIYDIENISGINILIEEFKNISDENIIRNYHPDYSDYDGNIFKILKNGRFKIGNGAYYILLNENNYICSAGWNIYGDDNNTVLLLTRAYTNPKYRNSFYLGNILLNRMINETLGYKNKWITFNSYNKPLYDWFVRASLDKAPSLSSQWPEIYRRFRPIGIKTVYNTEQYVVELYR